MVNPISSFNSPASVHAAPISEEEKKLESLLQKWVDTPEARGDKVTAKHRILEAFTTNSTSLTLSNLNLTLLPEGLFDFLPSLTELDLSLNELTSFTLPEGSLPSLTILNLYVNQLTSITLPEGSLPSLRELNLAHNKFTSITLLAGSFPSLTFLHLEVNQLTSFTLPAGSLPSLTHLNLSCNKLTSFTLPEGSLPLLTHLHLASNQFTSFTLLAGSLPLLRDLDLSYNKLTLFTPPEGSLPSLTHLNLSCNKLTSFTSPEGSLPSLTHLNLSYNKLTSFTPPEGSLPSLTHLKLSWNKLTSFTLPEGSLPLLTHLHLDSNQFTAFTLPAGSLVSLTQIYLSNNLQLTSFTLPAGSLPSLTHLYLSDNRNLTSIPMHLATISTLTYIGEDGTQISQESVRAILAATKALRRGSATERLPTLLNLWTSYAGQPPNTLSFLLELTAEEKGHVAEWLHRLSGARDFRTHQTELAQIVFDILKDVSNQEFKDLFIEQIQANNIDCGDRVAMGLNEIYTAWCITCPQKDTPLNAKLKMIAGVAKTGILRTTLTDLIIAKEKAQGTAVGESVEIYLYYESTLRDELGLITAIQSMLYPAMGKQDWIDEAYLTEQVELYYLDEAIKIDFFDKLFKEDESAQKALNEILEKFEARMEILDAKLQTETSDETQMSEGDYKKECDTLKEDRIAAENKMKKEWLSSALE